MLLSQNKTIVANIFRILNLKAGIVEFVSHKSEINPSGIVTRNGNSMYVFKKFVIELSKLKTGKAPCVISETEGFLDIIKS